MPKIPTIKGQLKFFDGKTFNDLKGEGLRLLAFGDEPDGSKVIYDCKVTYENADNNPS
jgi:hypothetical protein